VACKLVFKINADTKMNCDDGKVGGTDFETSLDPENREEMKSLAHLC